MANSKSVYLPYSLSGVTTLYAKVFQVATGFWLDYFDGVFRSSPADPEVPLTEQPPSTMVYSFSEDRAAWANGVYYIYGYDSNDFLFSSAEMFVLDDAEVSLSTLLDYMNLIRKIEVGSWELKMVGDDAYWIYYDTDGETPLIQFKCYDKNSRPSLLNIFKRIPV